MKTTTQRLLIADDQPHILEALALLLRPEGWEVHTARSPAEALRELASARFDAARLPLDRDAAAAGGHAHA